MVQLDTVALKECLCGYSSMSINGKVLIAVVFEWELLVGGHVKAVSQGSGLLPPKLLINHTIGKLIP